GPSQPPETYAFEYVHAELPQPSDIVPCAPSVQGAKCAPDFTKRVRTPGVRAEYFLERFVPVLRPSGNTKEPGSLGFTAEAASAPTDWVGLVADPLVPLAPFVPARAQLAPDRRTALWIDLEVSPLYDPRLLSPLQSQQEDAGLDSGDETVVEGKLLVVLSRGNTSFDAGPTRVTAVNDGAVGPAREPITIEKKLRIHVVRKELPYASRAFAFYSRESLATRLGVPEGDQSAERTLRRLLHRHWIDGVSHTTEPKHVVLEAEASSGSLFRADHAERTIFRPPSPGEEKASSPTVFGIYGAFGDPTSATARSVVDLHQSLLGKVGESFKPEPTFPFVYAIDEVCKSPRVPAWRALLDKTPGGERIAVGVTCSRDVAKEPADLVMTVAEAFPVKAGPPGSAERRSYCIANGITPSGNEALSGNDLADRSRDASMSEMPSSWLSSSRTPWAQCFHKHFWAYNGQRPYAGSMLLDVPATDLIANGWIAARYNVEKWFYWESIFWFDDNKGGKGGPDGLDPFVVSENFHNQHGDYAQGDGLLVYPSTQKPNGFIDLKREGWTVESDVIPSVRLKSLRRGQQDRALIEMARLSSPIAAEKVVLQMVPNALGEARIYPSWTENGGDYVSSRHTLRRLALGKTESFQRAEKVREEGRSGEVAVPSRLGTIAKYVSVIMMIALIYLMIRGLKK
ncbi:MAG: DUF4091 domain-containing protein, partial [Polyangiaceae bacterium]|nr:DUF4091 domain-containing protein [Polyangiaceae bacterium]